jgi:hypothetical protein
MKLKMVIACGMLLGLLSGVSFAQREHLGTGRTMPGARLPDSHPMGHIGDSSSKPPDTRVAPDAHKTASKSPNAKTPDHATDGKPDASKAPDHASDVAPDASKTPDRVPDNTTTRGRTDVGPTQ